MLFKQAHLEGIVSGEISLAFRKWKKPAVNKGSLINTSIGVVAITGIKEYPVNRITETDAVAAGYKDLTTLHAELSKIPEGILYRIEVHYHSEDPRIKLREQTSLTPEALTTLTAKLARLDQFSTQGSWTIPVLEAIRRYPNLKAATLAQLLGKEKDWLKLNIRKLKNLGLTISQLEGYTLSPLGEEYLASQSSSKQ
ncbi:ASCH domain-containing protein [Chitinophaga polysaccharea]|uniref:ASCH domain-containing protein n=1 Tax=Chitinophaga polysaccharea TaxID=1293035 RepID=UPI001159FB2F|nr:ASCH domain-containing protein [Chitinophaga polysaccharea]